MQINPSIHQPLVTVKSPDGAIATISPYGAQVLSWIPAGGEERLFLSPKAEFRAGAAIRGGVPVIFPQFAGTQFAGMQNLPKHGFARTQGWELARHVGDSAVFRLSETDFSRSLWPHRFLLEYTVRVAADRLEMRLSVTNTDILPFVFCAALHTYHKVADSRQAYVSGLGGLVYRDSTQGGKEARMDSDRLGFDSEIDRIYISAPADLKLVDPTRAITIHAEGFPDAVIWNPGPEKCARLTDMQPEGYLQFACVEAAAAARPISLAPGGIWQGAQILFA